MSAERRPSPHLHAPTPRDLLLVTAGGAIGALARAALAEAFPVADGAYPWTTFAENVAGAFSLALVLTLLVERFTTDPGVRLFLGTGALGAFTTYSTFATELAERLLDGHLTVAGGYAFASLLVGFLAALAGVHLARAWAGAARRRGAGPTQGRPGEGRP